MKIVEVKTSLGALSKNFVGIELDRRIMLGSVTLVRVSRLESLLSGSATVNEIDEIVYEYDRKHSQQLVYVAL